MTALSDTIAAVLATPAETFSELLDRVRAVCPEAEVTEIDATARPFERGEPGAYTYRLPTPDDCPCASEEVNHGPHIECCPWGDPDYDDEDTIAKRQRELFAV